MASFKEDLEYANKVLWVRTMLENQTYLSNPNFRHLTIRLDDVFFEYLMKRGEGDEIVIGHHVKRKDATCHNWYSWDTLITNPNNNVLQIGGVRETYRIDDDEITEEWHFQNSLLMEPAALTGLVIVTLLRTIPTKFEYFKFEIRHLDDIIRRYEL